MMAKHMPTTEKSISTAPYVRGDAAAADLALATAPANPPLRHPLATLPRSFAAVFPARSNAPCASMMNSASALVLKLKYLANALGGSGTSCFSDVWLNVSVANARSDSKSRAPLYLNTPRSRNNNRVGKPLTSPLNRSVVIGFAVASTSAMITPVPSTSTASSAHVPAMARQWPHHGA